MKSGEGNGYVNASCWRAESFFFTNLEVLALPFLLPHDAYYYLRARQVSESMLVVPATVVLARRG